MLPVRRKNSEKRKEKSRYAARARRSRESEIFTEMSALLPLHQTIDKASTMRLAVSLIRTRDLASKCTFTEIFKHDLASFDGNDDFGLIDNSLIDAFLIVLTSDGHIPYISENVEKYLGLKQIDLLGSTIFEFSHPCDHNDIRETLAHPFGSIPSPFLIRIKCTITSKGKTINLKSAAYKVIKLTGHWIGDDEGGYLCLVGEPLACPTKIDLPIADHMFLSRHSPDMKFTDIDERFTKILGYEQEDLIGKSVYYLFHALDCLSLSDCFKTLFVKGQSETGYYRLLAKRGGYTWIQTQATLITDNHTQQPIGVVCVNYALSGIENREEIISEEQCQERKRESYHLVDKTNDVRIKLAASTLIDSNTTTTGERIAVTNISDNNSNTSNSNQNNSRIDIKLCQQQQQQLQQEPSQSQQSITTISNYNCNNNQQFITSLSDYQLPSGILINTSENLLNSLVIDKSPPQQSSSCYSQVNSLINQQQSEEEKQELKHQQKYQHLQQTCSQGQLLDHQHPDQLEELAPIDQLPEILSTSFVPQSAPPVQLQQAVPLSTGPSLLFNPLIGTSLPSPTPATATIFAPRTADMNPGFLMPIGDDDNDFGLTVLPDIEACDPEQDLTHLAPQAGDFCVPLEIGPLPSFDGFSMDDILKEMGFVTSGAAPDTVTSLSSDTSTSTTTTVSSSTTNTTPTIISGIEVDDSVNSGDSIDECGVILQGKSDPIVDNIVLSSTLTPTKSTIRNSNSSVSSTPVASSSFVTSTKSLIPSSVITSIIGSKTQSIIDDTLSSLIKSNRNLMTPLATTTSTIIAVTGISSNVNAKDSELMDSFCNDNNNSNNNCNGLSLQSALTNTSVGSSSTTITRSPITVTSNVENIVDSINVNNNRNCNDSCVDGNNIGGNVTCDADDGVDCNTVSTDDNQHGDEEETLNFTDYLPTDSKLLPFIPTAVAEEEIQFSCDDDLTSETRGSTDTTGGCSVVTGGGVDDNDVIGDTNSLSDFLCNQRLMETPTIINQRGLTTTVTIPSTSTLSTNFTTSSKRINENDGRGGEDERRKSIKNGNILPSKCGLNKKDDVDFNRVSSKCDFTSGKEIIDEVDEDGDDDGDDISSICSPSSGGSVTTCNSSSGNLLLGMTLSSNRHGINGSSSPLHNDPFLSFTNGLGGLVSDNYLCSLSSSSSSSSSPSNFYVSSSRLTSISPDFTLTSAGSINNNFNNSNNSHHLNTKRPSSLCDSPPPSSCNSTLTSDLDLCGSFVPEDDDEFDSLGGRSGCGVNGRNDRTIQRHYDDEFPLLPNDESIWDTFIHSNDINDMINSDELLSSSTNHFPIDDYRLISVITSTKDSNNNNNNSSNKSSSSSPSLSTSTSIATTNPINSSPSSLSSNINYSSNAAGGVGGDSGSNGSSEINNNKDGANESFLLSNSNLAMLLQGKDTSFKNSYTLTNTFDCNKTTNNNQQSASSSQYQQQQQSAVSIAAATASRNRFHNYSANLPATGKSPLNTSPCSTSTLSSTSSTSSADSSRINSNYVIVQNNRSTIKTSSNHSNGTKDIIKSAQNNLQNCDMSRNEIDRKSDYFTLDSEMKKYRTMADSVYSKLGPSYVKIARKLAYNSSSSSSPSSSMPSPKRAYLPSKSSMENNYKRMKLPSTLPSMQGTSVLMNLLVNGEDVTNGYSRFQQQSHLKNNSINVNIG